MALTRDILKFSKLSNVLDFTNLSTIGHLKNVCSSISVRTAKHYNPRFRWLRSKKYIPIELPHSEKSKKRQREMFIKSGIFPRMSNDRPLTITTTYALIEPYVPEVGDGKASLLSKGVQGLTSVPKTKLMDMTALRKIKNNDENFKKQFFVQEAQDIYVNAHTVLMDKDPEELSKYVTEKANTDMLDGVKGKTIRWKFLESLEPPVIVQARTNEIVTKEYLFAQITVRFHTKQTLAIYDRFGRLIYGSEFIPKDVLEYVVFEKHINNKNGRWRLHAKIIPEWTEFPPLTRTYRIEEVVEEVDEEEVLLNERYPEPEPLIETEQKATSEIVKPEAKPST